MIMSKIYIYVLLLFSVLAFNGCKFEEDDVFSSSAAVRLNSAKANCREVLCGADNGWLMEYFATGESEGYTFLMKFDKSGAVTIAAKNSQIGNTYKSESSLYEVIGDNGPVLTFNSYNTLFTLFANPENPNGYGLEGDYEFIILKADANEVKLKGKKRGTYIYLRRLATSQAWPEYFKKLDAMKKAMFNSSVDFLNLIVAKDTIKAYDGLTGIFGFLEKGGDIISDKKYASFIVTDYGLRMHGSQSYYHSNFQDFVLSPDSAKLVSKENSAVYFEGPVLNNYLKSSTSTWKVDTFHTSANFNARLKVLIKALKTGFPTKNYEYFGISNKTTYLNSFVIKLTSSEGAYRVDFTPKGNGLIDIAMPTNGVNLYDNNGKIFFNKTIEVSNTLSYFCGEYKVSTPTPLAINSVRYERTSNPNEFFTVNR